jgi:hypothetical protein
MVLRTWGLAVAIGLLGSGSHATAQAQRGSPPAPPRAAGPRPLLYGFALECGECRWTRDQGDPRDIWQYSDLPHVAAVNERGAAARAGVLVGDTLIAVDGVSILAPEGARKLSLVRLGDRVTLTLRRAGQSIDKVLVLGPPRPVPGTLSATGQPFRYPERISGVPVAISSDAPLAISTDSSGALIIRTPGVTVRIESQVSSEHPPGAPAPKRP